MNPNNYDFQYLCTGSRQPWNDIVVIRALISIQNGSIVTFREWPYYLGGNNWEDIIGVWTPKLRGIDRVLTSTLFHELIHSIANPTPFGIPPLLMYYVFGHDADDGI